MDSKVYEDWITFFEHQSINDLKQIIEEENLKEVETFKFMENAFRDGAIKTIGTDIDKILPPMSLFGGRAKKKSIVLEKLNKYFEKYEGLM